MVGKPGSATTAGGLAAYGDSSPTGLLEHVAMVLDDGQLSVFVDGQPLAKSVQYATRGSPQELLPALIGAFPAGKDKRESFFTGTIGELRIANIARYRTALEPLPCFEYDANTLALYHFDEGAGEVLRDSSGHNHHGKIVGAKWVKISREEE